MKKTLIVTMEFPPQVGGIASYIETLAGALPPERVIILADGTTNKQLHENDALRPYTVIRRSFLFPLFLWPRWLRLMFLLWRTIKKHHIELVMVHHVLPVGTAMALLSRITKTRFILFSHGTDVSAGAATRHKRRLVAYIAKRAAGLIFNSESLKRRFLEIHPTLEDRSIVIYPCPDKMFFKPMTPDERGVLRHQHGLDGKVVMLSVARFTDGKGLTHLMRLLPKVLEHVSHVVWLVVGDGPKRPQMMAEVQRLGLQNVVRFLGEMPHDSLRSVYGMADFFSLLTHPDEGREEGLGLVFLEAAAMGLPAVAGRSGGVEEGIIHGETGLIFDVYRQQDAIVEAIIALTTNTAYRTNMGIAAHTRILSEFVWQHQLEKIREWLD